MPSNEELKWGKLEEPIEITVVRTYLGREIVSKADLEKIWRVTPKTIQRYVADGMPRCDVLWKRNFQIFYLDECVEWKQANIDRKQSARVNKHKKIKQDTVEEDVAPPPPPTDDNDMPIEEAERREKVAKAKMAEIKLKEAEGLLIPADDLDKAMYEQAIMHKTDKSNDEKILPILLEMKNQEEIRDLLESHNDDRLELLDSQLEQRHKNEPTNYDIFNHILVARKKGKTPQEIIKGIKC